MLSSVALAYDASDIKLVQQKLSAYGAGEADGRMGSKTRAAIKGYQRDWGLAETGEISDELIQMLKRKHPRTKAQWFKVSNTTCWIWSHYFIQPRSVVTWSGDCVEKKISGSGRIVRSYTKSGSTQQDTYEGEVAEGVFHGSGQHIDANGNSYKGEYRNGHWHGQGVLTWADGARYEGEFKNGKMHGRGVFTWANGTRYEGEHKDNYRHGRGVQTFASGNRYEGEYKDGKPHGRGTYITASGQREYRRWRNGCSTLRGRDTAINTTLQACGF